MSGNLPVAPVAPKAEVAVQYQVLLDLRGGLATLTERINNVLANQARMDDLEKRLRAAELTLAAHGGNKAVWRWVLDSVIAVGLAVIGAGYFLKH